MMQRALRTVTQSFCQSSGVLFYFIAGEHQVIERGHYCHTASDAVGKASGRSQRASPASWGPCSVGMRAQEGIEQGGARLGDVGLLPCSSPLPTSLALSPGPRNSQPSQHAGGWQLGAWGLDPTTRCVGSEQV